MCGTEYPASKHVETRFRSGAACGNRRRRHDCRPPRGRGAASVNCAGIEILEKGGEWRRASGDRAMGEKIELTCRTAKIGLCRAPTGERAAGIRLFRRKSSASTITFAPSPTARRHAGYLAICAGPVRSRRAQRRTGLRTGRSPARHGSARQDACRDDAAGYRGGDRGCEAGRKVALVGYCWGGTLAFLGACRLSGLTASVGYYGGGIATIASERPRIPHAALRGARQATFRSRTSRRSGPRSRPSRSSSTTPTTVQLRRARKLQSRPRLARRACTMEFLAAELK